MIWKTLIALFLFFVVLPIVFYGTLVLLVTEALSHG